MKSGATIAPEVARLFESRVRELAASRPASKFFHADGSRRGRGARRNVVGNERHIAARHELAAVVSGRANVNTAEAGYSLSPGELLVIEPGTDHAEWPADLDEAYVMYWVTVDSREVCIKHTGYSPSEGFGPGPNVELWGRTEVESIVAAIGTELANRAWGWEHAVRGLLQYLSCILVRRLKRGTGGDASPESPTLVADRRLWEVVERARAYCQAHLDTQLRTGEVAEAVGYSASRLSHLFSAYLGQSLADYLRGLRLAEAQDLLESTDLPIRVIAERLGYSDPSHFTRAFTRRQRVSPKAYRRRCNGG